VSSIDVDIYNLAQRAKEQRVWRKGTMTKLRKVEVTVTGKIGEMQKTGHFHQWGMGLVFVNTPQGPQPVLMSVGIVEVEGEVTTVVPERVKFLDLPE